MQLEKKVEAQAKGVRKKIQILITLGFISIFALSILISLGNGQANISFQEVWHILVYKVTNGAFASETIESINQATVNIVWFVRTPRILAAVFVGCGLAVSGAVMQAVVQNPLADPYILGISSGASLGATFAIMIGFGSASIFSQMGLSVSAFIGALLATFFVLLLSSVGGKMTSIKLVLSGTVINSVLGAISSLIIFLANNAEGMKTVTFWSMGSLASASWAKLPFLAIVTSIAVLFFCTQYRILNTLLLGEETATTLGISLTVYRRLYMLIASLLTGIIVASSGMIGFVGLIIPHIVRGIYGSTHKILIPMSGFVGALFLIWTDLLSRILLPNTELPIGILTAIIGAPIFIYIILKKEYRFGG
ncbi:iron complex transport system permease [Enterococcus sp. AZ194]|uniref:FecCD family ABC transporter permease n=1 Tax=Enterococcus sp. AZ194 TaxID=2774629 RepID=UPI003F26D83F